MSTSFKKVLLFIILFVVVGEKDLQAQSVLDQYIAEALSGNEGLKQQNLQLAQALNALKQAKTLYYPNVSLLGSYTRAAGGRTIDFPVGDLLNPVYGSLNELTHSTQFPRLENASILLNPDNFYDTKFRTSLPLLNMEIYYNQRIRKEGVTQQQAAVNVYKRQLIKEIKEAYFRYYEAVQAVNIYKSAANLVNDNVRVNQSLVRNAVKNNTVLIRALAEQDKIRAAEAKAESIADNARLYFNFLLNRSHTSEIMIDSVLIAVAPEKGVVMQQREELLQIRSAIEAYKLNTRLQQAYLIPKLNTFLDLGSQGFDFEFNNKSRYFFWGLNLQWDLFAAGQNTRKIDDAKYRTEITESQYRSAEQAYQMQAQQAENNLNTAVINLKNAHSQLQFADRYYTDAMKMYKEGQSLYIELIDALEQLTQARIQEAIARADIQIAEADKERQMATYPLPTR